MFEPSGRRSWWLCGSDFARIISSAMIVLLRPSEREFVSLVKVTIMIILFVWPEDNV